MEPFEDVELTEAQALAIARAMLAVARADGGADPRELALIGGLAAVDPSASDPSPAEVAAALPDAGTRELLLRSMLLVALVDGDYTEEERRVVAAFAEACGVAPDRLEELASSVKAYLMAPLLPLSNTPAVLDVSRRLKL